MTLGIARRAMGTPMIKKLLLVEDDISDQTAFKRLFWEEKAEYDYTVVDSVSEARAILDTTSFDIIITDYLLGDGTGFEILEMGLDVPVIMTTGGGSEEVAVRAMKAGAYDYLIKDPGRNYIKMLLPTIDRALKLKKTEDQVRIISERESERSALIGRGLDDVRRLAGIAAASDSPVLITGETGTGKNLVAKAIHYMSPARKAPFIPSLPELQRRSRCVRLPQRTLRFQPPQRRPAAPHSPLRLPHVINSITLRQATQAKYISPAQTTGQGFPPT